MQNNSKPTFSGFEDLTKEGKITKLLLILSTVNPQQELDMFNSIAQGLQHNPEAYSEEFLTNIYHAIMDLSKSVSHNKNEHEAIQKQEHIKHLHTQEQQKQQQELETLDNMLQSI